jgi:hypothetical protein
MRSGPVELLYALVTKWGCCVLFHLLRTLSWARLLYALPRLFRIEAMCLILISLLEVYLPTKAYNDECVLLYGLTLLFD